MPGKLDSPEWRSERARKAAAARHSLDTYIKAVAARRAELTDSQRDLLRALASPVSEAA